jgi:hypothetical protein
MPHANRDVGGWRKKINIAKTYLKKPPPQKKVIWKKMRLLQAIPSKSERADPTQQACKNCDAKATLSSPSPPSSLPPFRSSFLLSHAAHNSRSKPPNPNSPSQLPFLASVLFVCSICYDFHGLLPEREPWQNYIHKIWCKVKPEVEGIIEIRACTTTSPRPLFW